MKGGRLRAALVLALAAACLAALTIAARPTSLAEVWAALVAPEPGNPVHVVVREMRLPRLAAGLAAGAALGVAGALMQAVTRNPLAEPGLMGVNAGAGLAVVLGASLGWSASPALLAFPGAGAAALAVLLLGGGRAGGLGPARLALAGMALNAFLLSAVTALVLTSLSALDEFRFWTIGTLADASARPLLLMAGLIGAGLIGALLMAPAFDVMALGDEAARSLGLRLGAVRLGALALISVLAGAAAVVAGPLIFVGLMAPHLARLLAGPTTRPMFLASGLIGALVLILCDVAGRVVLPPGEVRAGTMTALIGGLAFILVARRASLGASS
ncbi:iron ABC transporter permease [Neomegalonema sp.]|uniref:FecCD family ABC transporter permease n=1 Tax=Neomegalonema sp. TaxID=2039713 RepID=UPI002636D748|nr:iron ABC transporter permease [Neomegalonema sp.]MDD2868461.1 iron ABC transporter permease [Neomegalonema sp.]